MATNLIDILFNYFFTIISNVLHNYINFAIAAYKIIDINSFAYITIDQYLSDKFYRIIIDTGVSKHFIASYRQFIAYTRDIKYTTIDIFKISAIHV